MTTKSQAIREMARAGHPVSEIARALNIAYQHAYKVCRDAGLVQLKIGGPEKSARGFPSKKPVLSVQTILAGGFTSIGCWTEVEARLALPTGLPHQSGVYAFSIGDEVVYVGLASRSLVQRIYGYGNPDPSQRTNIRLNALIRKAIAAGRAVEVHLACPPSFEWNGLTVSGSEGLEAGLIQSYFLPWNVRGAN